MTIIKRKNHFTYIKDIFMPSEALLFSLHKCLNHSHIHKHAINKKSLNIVLLLSIVPKNDNTFKTAPGNSKTHHC